MERDLAALEDKVMTLGQEAARLCGIHPDHADQIKAKHQEIENNWESLTGKAKVIDWISMEFFFEPSCVKDVNKEMTSSVINDR